jgi:hypothetical protein
VVFDQGQILTVSWGAPMTLASLGLSMAVNTLVTGLIVFRILKVFLQVKSARTSIERTLGSAGGTPLRHIIFVVIESGMALFAIQLVRFVVTLMPVSDLALTALNVIICINEMFNVIIWSVHFILLFRFTDNIFTWLGNRTDNNFIAGLDEIVLQWQRLLHGSCRKSSF